MGRFPARVLPVVLMCAGALLASSSAGARPLFVSRVANPSGLFSMNGTDSLLNIAEIFNPDQIALGFVQGGGAVAATLDLRGLPVDLRFELNPAAIQARRVELVLSIAGDPLITLLGNDVEETLQDLEDLVRGTLDDPTGTVNQVVAELLQGLLANSPVDPVAGNPNSLQTRMLMADWEGGLELPLTSGPERISGEDLFRLGFDYDYSKSGDWSVNTLSLPLGYRANFKNPKWSILLDLPITATVTGSNAWSLFASLGLGFQYRPFDWWAITPMARIGGAGSIDVGALGVLYGATVTSHIRVPLGPVRLGIGNTLGFNKSIDDITIRDINIAYHLTNGVFRNGGYIEGDFTEGFGWKFFGNDIRFVGTDLFTDFTDEVGIGVQSYGRIGGRRYHQLALTASYVWARQYDGAWLRLRWRF